MKEFFAVIATEILKSCWIALLVFLSGVLRCCSTYGFFKPFTLSLNQCPKPDASALFNSKQQ